MLKVLSISNHTIMGKLVEIKSAQTKEETVKRLDEEKKKKLYINEIDPNINKGNFNSLLLYQIFNRSIDMLTKYFTEFGTLDFVKIVSEKKKNGKVSNYAFIMFKEEGYLEKVLEKGETHIINGFTVQCNKLLTRDELKQKMIEKDALIKQEVETKKIKQAIDEGLIENIDDDTIKEMIKTSTDTKKKKKKKKKKNTNAVLNTSIAQSSQVQQNSNNLSQESQNKQIFNKPQPQENVKKNITPP